MADRPGRRQQPFRFWLPPWSSSSRASHPPPQQPQPQPSSSSSTQPASQSTPPSSQAPAPIAARTQTPTPLPSPSQRSSQQPAAVEGAAMQPRPSHTPSHQLTKVLSSSSSGRRQSLPPQATQVQPPTAQVESPTKELANESGTQVGSEAQTKETSLPQEEKPSHPAKIIEVETLQKLEPKTSPAEPLDAEASTTQQSLTIQNLSKEGKNKTESESKQVTQEKSSSIRQPISEAQAEVSKDLEPWIDIEPQKDPRAELASRNQSLKPDAQLEKVQEEKPEKDLEAELKPDMNHIKAAATDKITEEIQSKEGESKRLEAPEESPNNQATEVPKKASKPKLSITVFDSKLASYHTRNRELMSPGRVTEPDTPEEPVNGTLKESTMHSSARKERKIAISTMPQASSPNLVFPSMRKNLKDGLSRLVQKLSIGHQNRLCGEQGVNIITLAGENKGASMFIGSEGFSGEGPIYIHGGQKQGKSTVAGEENNHNEKNANSAMTANINSNVQGINNSILDEAKYRERNPGVHMTISTKPTAPVSIKGKVESRKSQKVASCITQPQKLTFEPNIRRRCLRGLFLESSEDDKENPQKPHSHGCRFSCDDKMKKNVEATATFKI